VSEAFDNAAAPDRGAPMGLVADCFKIEVDEIDLFGPPPQPVS
jgi:hypothetical protein